MYLCVHFHLNMMCKSLRLSNWDKQVHLIFQCWYSQLQEHEIVFVLWKIMYITYYGKKKDYPFKINEKFIK